VAVRIYSLAKDIGLDSKELVDLCTRLGILNKGSALASLDDDEIVKIKRHLAEKSAPAAAAPAAPAPTREPVKEAPIRDPGARFGAAKRDLAASAKKAPIQTKRDEDRSDESSESVEVELVADPVAEPAVAVDQTETISPSPTPSVAVAEPPATLSPPQSGRAC